MNLEPSEEDEPAPARSPAWGTTEFRLGPHVGLVGRWTVGLVEFDHPSTRERLWRLVSVDAPIDVILDELSSTGLNSLPAFGLAQVDGGEVRLVARGSTTIEVTRDDGKRHVIDAAGVRTWVEEAVTGVRDVSIGLPVEPASEPDQDSRSFDASVAGDRFFVLAGSVPAASLLRRFDEADPLAHEAAAGWFAGRVDHDDGAAGAEVDVGDVGGEVAGGSAEDVNLVEPLRSGAAQTLSASDLGDESLDADAADSTTTGSPATDDFEVQGGDFDFIFGHTVARSVEGAAVRVDEGSDGADGVIDSVPSGADTPSSRAGIAQVSRGLPGDHDGLTVSRDQMTAMQSGVGAPLPSTETAAEHVPAVLCEQGHPNPPQAVSCRMCSRAIRTGVPQSIPRPPLGILVFANGERVIIDRTILIGRNPRVAGAMTGELPRIVKFEDAGQGLSRTHAEVRIEGWQMLLEDLQSTNGTEVTLPGQPARRLHAGDPVGLVPGAMIDFGDELRCVVEVVA